MGFVDICEDGKVVVALWIAETAIQAIDGKEKDYQFCRETIDLCWAWLMNKNISIYDLYGRIASDEINLLDIVMDTQEKDPKLSDQYDIILVNVSYVTWQVFTYDKDVYGYPEDLNEMNDEDFEGFINKLAEDNIIEKSRYESLLCYLKENYCEENKSEIKELLQNKSLDFGLRNTLHQSPL